MRKFISNMNTIKHKYNCQKGKAKHRGIDFNLTFDEWWEIWQQSGKWEQRGFRKGQYVMSRKNDIGPYAIGNVFIQPAEDNHSQVVFNDEVMKGFSERHKGKSKPKVECPHCKKMIAVNTSKRWHFDNCKDKV